VYCIRNCTLNVKQLKETEVLEFYEDVMFKRESCAAFEKEKSFCVSYGCLRLCGFGLSLENRISLSLNISVYIPRNVTCFMYRVFNVM
jgi:hypothetical protein